MMKQYAAFFSGKCNLCSDFGGKTPRPHLPAAAGGFFSQTPKTILPFLAKIFFQNNFRKFRKNSQRTPLFEACNKNLNESFCRLFQFIYSSSVGANSRLCRKSPFWRWQSNYKMFYQQQKDLKFSKSLSQLFSIDIFLNAGQPTVSVALRKHL